VRRSRIVSSSSSEIATWALSAEAKIALKAKTKVVVRNLRMSKFFRVSEKIRGNELARGPHADRGDTDAGRVRGRGLTAARSGNDAGDGSRADHCQ
jgi:hypothetical protein